MVDQGERNHQRILVEFEDHPKQGLWMDLAEFLLVSSGRKQSSQISITRYP